MFILRKSDLKVKREFYNTKMHHVSFTSWKLPLLTISTYGYLLFESYSTPFTIQTFVWSIICLFTLLVIRIITPIPRVMEAGKWRKKMFPFCPRNPWSTQPTTYLLQLSYPHNPVVGGPPPCITAAGQRASPRTLRDRRTMYSHTGQYDHKLSKKQLYQVTHSLYPEDFIPKISLWLQLKHSNW